MQISKRLLESPLFTAQKKEDVVIARRKRSIPLRGLFRLIFPLSMVRVQTTARGEKISIRPDGWGWSMLFMCLMGVIVEITMPRHKYPRNYPPAFVFIFAAVYVSNLCLDLYLTRRALKKIQ